MGQKCNCHYGKMVEKQCSLSNHPMTGITDDLSHTQFTVENIDKQSFAPIIPKVNLILSHIRGYAKRKRFILGEREELQLFSDDIYNTFINQIAKNSLVDEIEQLDNGDNKGGGGGEEVESININTGINMGMSYNQLQTKSSVKSNISKIDRVKFTNRIIIAYLNYPNINNTNTTTSTITNIKAEILNKAISIYKGDVNLNNQKHGNGKLIHRDGSKEIGSWLMNKFSGLNKYINDKGVLFKGNFIDGKLSGKGERYAIGKQSYKGYFNNSLRDGFGIEVTSKGTYEGMFKDNMKNGKGKIQFESGDVYEGDFVNNKFDGIGRYIWKKNGHEYVGGYKNGKFHGKGFYKSSDIEYYKGDYVNGVKEGQGEIHIKANCKFIGPFIQGHPNGVGYYENAKGFKGEVEFINGKIKKKNKPNRQSL